jgi:hypothetical protein
MGVHIFGLIPVSTCKNRTDIGRPVNLYGGNSFVKRYRFFEFGKAETADSNNYD